jgi:hypothetical protein
VVTANCQVDVGECLGKKISNSCLTLRIERRMSIDVVKTRTQLLAVEGRPIALALLMAALLIVAAVVLWVVAARAANGSLGPNRWAGLRTGATMASPEVWVAANRAAQAGMQTAAVILGVTGVAVGVLAWTTDLLPLILLVGIALTFGALVRATIFGHRAAKNLGQYCGPSCSE